MNASTSTSARRPAAAGGRRPLFARNVARGIHRLGHAHTNCYLVEEGTELTLVDALFPASWRHLERALESIGRRPSDVSAIVLTHAHFDHVGFAARAHRDLGMPVWVHDADRRLAAHPYRYGRERTPFAYPFRYPGAVPLFASMVKAGALMVQGVTDVATLPVSGVLDVPGRPSIVATPGHTNGHVSLHFGDRGAVVSGDALVTLDPYKASRGPQVIAGAATANSQQALASLTALEATGAQVVLPGHGEPWREGVAGAVALAREAGAS
ncbi:MBL fold metallo-hydrolase [Salinibacterium sp. SYSU T00001]|uniref:MBL fold metallo-hydrolase n=1 Tax=Homoserinimonas sedimenticola TaxID=2986805 RepID=UPI002235F9C1|nr:MBL fold metallo-hydrolase [Salinibacterium sedimenticola]MCW4385753.1 MBL fold metallo-hydrolase [Salinibacterium sedimenticola]